MSDINTQAAAWLASFRALGGDVFRLDPMGALYIHAARPADQADAKQASELRTMLNGDASLRAAVGALASVRPVDPAQAWRWAYANYRLALRQADDAQEAAASPLRNALADHPAPATLAHYSGADGALGNVRLAIEDDAALSPAERSARLDLWRAWSRTVEDATRRHEGGEGEGLERAWEDADDAANAARSAMWRVPAPDLPALVRKLRSVLAYAIFELASGETEADFDRPDFLAARCDSADVEVCGPALAYRDALELLKAAEAERGGWEAIKARVDALAAEAEAPGDDGAAVERLAEAEADLMHTPAPDVSAVLHKAKWGDGAEPGTTWRGKTALELIVADLERLAQLPGASRV